MIPTQDQVRHVARLARLHLSDAEVILYQEQLASIFGYIEKIQSVDVSGVQEAIHASRSSMLLRKDEVSMPDDPEKLLDVTHQEIIG